jgi:hypothetical protein
VNRKAYSRVLALGALILCSWCGEAFAVTYTITPTSGSLALTYSTSSAVYAASTITVTRSTSTSALTCYIGFKESSTPTLIAGENISYNLYADTNWTTVLSRTGRTSSTGTSDVIKVSFAKGVKTATVSYYFRVTTATFPAAGSYISKFTAKLYGATGTSVLKTSSTITATTTVSKIAQVTALSSTADSYDFTGSSSTSNYSLSLGTIAPGVTSSNTANIRTRANAGYTIAMTSANEGKLVNSSDSESAIDYTITVGSVSNYALSSLTTVYTGTATYSSTVDNSITVKAYYASTSLPTAGTFTDTITITVATTN